MSRNSALIKFGYSHHKEYDDEKAGNKKHSAKCKFCPTSTTISDRSGTTSSFVTAHEEMPQVTVSYCIIFEGMI